MRSNIDDDKDFFLNYHPKFHPIEAKLNTSGSDLLKLLVGPLYGNSPALGVRELIQNSVDAVRELKFLCDRDRINYQKITNPDQESDVSVCIEKDDQGRDFLIISDKGIGMTPETIVKYFMVAGASIRQSQPWQHEFMNDQEPNILYSGRFGIGVFACFLLGNKIIVSTRNYGSKPEDGVYFEAALNEEFVELKCKKLDSVGTTIKILLNDDAESWLANKGNAESWDWYAFDDPSVERYVFKDKLIQRFHLPAEEKKIAEYPSWNHLFTYGTHVFWNVRDCERLPYFAHNGLILTGYEIAKMYIPHRKNNPYHFDHNLNCWIHSSIFDCFPSLSMIDPIGIIPLNLTKTLYSFPSASFLEDIIVSQLRDFLAFILLVAHNKPGHLFTSDYKKESIKKYISQFGLRDAYRNIYFLHNQKGTIIFNQFFLAAPSTPYVICLLGYDKYTPYKESNFKKLCSIENVLFASAGRINYAIEPHIVFEASEEEDIWVDPNIFALHHLGSELLFDLGDFLHVHGKLVNHNWYVDDYAEYITNRDNDKLSQILDDFITLGLSKINIIKITFPQTKSPYNPLIMKFFKKYLNDSFIPYSKNERQKKYALAYYELAPQIKKWNELLSN